jgi:hypothetical protein
MLGGMEEHDDRVPLINAEGDRALGRLRDELASLEVLSRGSEATRQDTGRRHARRPKTEQKRLKDKEERE